MRLNLRNRRLELKLTQRKLAELVGISDRTIGALEKSRILGSVGVWDRLEAVLGRDQKILRMIFKEKS